MQKLYIYILHTQATAWQMTARDNLGNSTRKYNVHYQF